MRGRFSLFAMTALAACATGAAVVTPVTTLAPPPQSSVETLLAVAALCAAEESGLAAPVPDLKLAAGMGTGGFKVDTASSEAQAWFNYGLALSHAFYHQDVKAAMKRAVELDPACSLCSWGEAWALGPTLNYGIDEDDRKLALAAAVRAQTLVKPGDDLARRLADAMVARYAEPPAAAATPVAGAKAGEAGVVAEDTDTEPAFAQALTKIAADYPEHVELTVLAAHSLMMASSEEKPDGLKTALVLLERVLKDHPDDTGAIHYYIHATEFDDRAEDALSYAKRLGGLAPAASHLVHMPAHTFFRAGLYQEAAVVNAQAIAADSSWMAGGGDPRPPMIDNFPAPMYYSHNLAFGLAGAMMSGDGELALRYAEHAAKAYPETGEKVRFDPTPRTYVALARYAPDQISCRRATRRARAPNSRSCARSPSTIPRRLSASPLSKAAWQWRRAMCGPPRQPSQRAPSCRRKSSADGWIRRTGGTRSAARWPPPISRPVISLAPKPKPQPHSRTGSTIPWRSGFWAAPSTPWPGRKRALQH
ncbi:MAG: hypothetical protein B7Y90_06615 [Alphaproteobacteria bacterium 32-64-14]|nr:MAG: hypothetical protein B7Y90_06615 [Alphaproteobacteria bacterium 32-64-14]